MKYFLIKYFIIKKKKKVLFVQIISKKNLLFQYSFISWKIFKNSIYFDASNEKKKIPYFEFIFFNVILILFLQLFIIFHTIITDIKRNIIYVNRYTFYYFRKQYTLRIVVIENKTRWYFFRFIPLKIIEEQGWKISNSFFTPFKIIYIFYSKKYSNYFVEK